MKDHIVLLHGWGLNSQVWDCITKQLASHFKLHLIDIPGFDYNCKPITKSLDEIAKCILQQIPEKTIWLGWSFGGLIASWIALMYPKMVKALITVASSPCFIAKDSWPGINIELLDEFQHQLSKNFQNIIERFIALQTKGTDTAYRDIKILKKNIKLTDISLERKVALSNELEILKTVDLRAKLAQLSIPHFRIYGALDKLVPCEIAHILDKHWPNSKSLILAKSAHVPFISHTNEFCQSIINFNYQLRW